MHPAGMSQERRTGQPAGSGSSTEGASSQASAGTLGSSLMVTATMVIIGAGVWSGLGDRAPLAVAMMIALIAAAAVSPSGALGATVLAIPTAFDIHPLVIGSFSLLEIGILALAAGLGIRTVLGGLTPIITVLKDLAEPVEVVLPALLLVPSAALAVVMMQEPTFRAEALREIRLVILEPLVFLGCALVVFREFPSRAYVCACAVAVGAVVSGLACLELVTQTGNVADGAVMRATATYSHPNNLALFLERTFLITLPLALRQSRSWILWACIVLQAAGVIATFSRGALVAVVAGSVVAMLMLGLRRELVRLGAVVAAGGLLLLVIARDRVLDLGGAGTEPTRFAIWRSAVRMALDNPLFGVGPDQFLYQYSRRYIEPAAWPERYTSHPHNLPLDLWLRLGVPGVACAITLAAVMAARVVASMSTLRADAIAVGGLAALIGGLAHGMFDNGFFLPDLAVLTWLAVAFVVTASSARHSSVLPTAA